MDEHFPAVAKATGAESGDGGFYRGLLGHTPFLLKQTASEPPGYYFKFRKKGRPTCLTSIAPRRSEPLPADSPLPAAWHDSLPEDYAKAGVRCDVEEDYVFLWIDQPLPLAPGAIAFLAQECVREHAALLPDQAALCLTCGSTGEASLVQSNASVATVCPGCLEQTQLAHTATVEKLNRSDATVSLLLPLALLGGGVVWAVFWSAFDMLFSLLQTNRILIPIWIAAVVAVGVGFGAGWPIGKILHRSGAVKRLSAGALSLFAALAIVAFGELLYALWTVFLVTESFDLSLALRLTLPFSLGDQPTIAFTKFMFACALGFTVYEVSKLKTKKMQV